MGAGDQRTPAAGGGPDLGEQAQAASGKPRTLGELRDWLLVTHWNKQKSAKTARINADEVVAIIGASKPILKVDGFEVGKLKAALDKKGNSNATINRKLASLSRMLTEAIRLEVIDRKPHIQKLKETESRHFRVNRELEGKMTAHFDRIGHPDMAAFVMVSVDTGLRQGEVLRLRWSDVEVAAIKVYETKGGRNRVVPSPRAAGPPSRCCRGRWMRAGRPSSTPSTCGRSPTSGGA